MHPFLAEPVRPSFFDSIGINFNFFNPFFLLKKYRLCIIICCAVTLGLGVLLLLVQSGSACFSSTATACRLDFDSPRTPVGALDEAAAYETCYGTSMPHSARAAGRRDRGGARRVPLAELVAGDHVLALDPTTGSLYADRVALNLHASDALNAQPTVVLHHAAGSIELTPEHMLWVVAPSGGPASLVAARDAAGGSLLLADGSLSPVTHATTSRAAVVNPVTTRGAILVSDGGGAQRPVLASVVDVRAEWPQQMLRLRGTVVTPLLSLASYHLPARVQAAEWIVVHAIDLLRVLDGALPPSVLSATVTALDVALASAIVALASARLMLPAVATLTAVRLAAKRA